MFVEMRVDVRGDTHTTATMAAEIISAYLFDSGAQAVGQEGDSIDPVLVVGFRTDADAISARSALLERLPTFVRYASIEKVSSDEWVNNQRSGLRPSTIGQWKIRPPWHDAPTAVDAKPTVHDIVIDPGPSFGHGAHPTTRLVIDLMSRHLAKMHPPPRVVDLGTGSGVVAIVAARSGANALAVDDDPTACEVARQNVELNSQHPFGGTKHRITVRCQDATDMRIARDDLVVANLTLDVQRLVAPACGRADRVIASGVLCSQVRVMEDLYPTHVASTICVLGEWAAIQFSSRRLNCRKNSNE